MYLLILLYALWVSCTVEPMDPVDPVDPVDSVDSVDSVDQRVSVGALILLANMCPMSMVDEYPG